MLTDTEHTKTRGIAIKRDLAGFSNGMPGELVVSGSVVMFEDALGALCRRGCRFVVVGSVARALKGERVHPHDLDVVVDASFDDRQRLRLALADLGTTIETRDGWRRIERCTSLPWDWGFRAWTAVGQIDVITRFIDGTTIDDHDAHATTIEIDPGIAVRVHPTRHVEAA